MNQVWKFIYNMILPIGFGLITYGVAAAPTPAGIALLSGYGTVILRWSIIEVKDALPEEKWPPIYITRDQLEGQPDLVAEHLRIILALRANIEERERTSRAQFAMANRIDSGDEPDSKAPAEGFRMAARANQWSANYLRRTLNKEEP